MECKVVPIKTPIRGTHSPFIIDEAPGARLHFRFSAHTTSAVPCPSKSEFAKTSPLIVPCAA
jgi:hypothetical protein